MIGDAGRRFTLLDAMILVAATSCVLLAAGPSLRLLALGLGRLDIRRLLEARYLRRLAHGETSILWNGLSVTSVSLVYWTPSVLLLRVLRPRPPLHDLLRQPGVLACGVATASLFLIVVLLDPVTPYGFPFGPLSVVSVPMPVALAWAWLGLTRRWGAEASWIDRLGRAVGIGWVLSTIQVIWVVWANHRQVWLLINK
jgi:hypothetical protein